MLINYTYCYTYFHPFVNTFRFLLNNVHSLYYMSAHDLLNLLNELGKRDKMRGLPSILSLFRNKFNKFNNTRARMLDSIYHMTNTLKPDFWCENVIILSLCTQRCYGLSCKFSGLSILLHGVILLPEPERQCHMINSFCSILVKFTPHLNHYSTFNNAPDYWLTILCRMLLIISSAD